MPPPLGPRISLSFRFSLPYTTGHVRSYTPRAHAAAATAVLAHHPRRNGRHRVGFLDILLVTGDAYAGSSFLRRACSAAGWSDTATAWASWPSRAGRTRGRASPTSPAWADPRLFTGVSAGALDSMLAHYGVPQKTPR
ncbi:MAG: hypothetical protein ACLSAH_01420 [Bilophila wadsworthia]